MENLHTPKTPVSYPDEPHETASPLTPLGQQILAAHPARRQASEFTTLSEQFASAPPWLLLLWFAGPLLLADLTLMPIGDLGSSVHTDAARIVCTVLMVVCFGAIALQATFLSVYVAFSSDPWWQRLVVFIPLVVVFAGAGLFSTGFVYWYREWEIEGLEVENGFRFFCALPLVALAGLVPLTFFRWIFGWSLVRNTKLEEEKGTKHVYRPASILNMLLLTAAIAGGFGMIRVAPVMTLDEPGELWVIVGVLATVSAGFSICGGLPLIILFHYVRSSVWRIAFGLVMLLIGVSTATVAFALLASWDFFVEQALFNVAIFGGVILTYLIGLSLYLQLLSACGWTIRPTNYVLRAK